MHSHLYRLVVAVEIGDKLVYEKLKPGENLAGDLLQRLNTRGLSTKGQVLVDENGEVVRFSCIISRTVYFTCTIAV